MSTAALKPGNTCICNDPDVEQLRRYVAAGHDQRDASRLLWGDQAPVSNALAVEHAGHQARELTRRTLATAFPWLRLPAPIEQEAR